MAKKRNWLEELQNIATQAVGPVDTKPEIADEEINKAAIAKVNEVTALANQMYPQDANSRFDFWKSQVDIAGLPSGAKNTYWKNYETMHPDGIDGATRDFINVTKRELDMIPGMSQKEFFLRERVTQTPDWARKELEPLLAQVSTTVANANLNKAQQVYASDLDTRVNAFLSKVQLDPDVAIEDHVNDMMKLEQMNLLEMAQVKNGRVGFMKDGTQFVPAFGLQDSDQVLQNRAVTPSLGEQVLVREVGLQPIKNAVESNVTKGRREIETQEQTAKAIATRSLRDGIYQMAAWDKAFSLIPDMPMEDRVVLGLQGEINSGRIRDEKQLAQAIYMTIDRYRNNLTPATEKLKDVIPDNKVWDATQANFTAYTTRPSPYVWEAKSWKEVIGQSDESKAAWRNAAQANAGLTEEQKAEVQDLTDVMMRSKTGREIPAVSPGALSDKAYMKVISEFEGLKTEAYYDANGKVWTIGKGTTTYPDGRPVKQGDKITKEEAEKYADDFVQKKVIPKLEDTIPTWADMNENQKAAIISFAYNVGPGFYGRKGFETITKALSSADNFKDVPQALALYKKSGGKVLSGLVRRREAEGKLFSTTP